MEKMEFVAMFGNELKKGFGNKLHLTKITSASFNRFRVDRGAIVFRCKTLLNATGYKQVEIRPYIGSSNYDIATQGMKVVDNYYQYGMIDPDTKEITVQGKNAILALEKFFTLKTSTGAKKTITAQYLETGIPVTDADMVIQSIVSYIGAVNEGRATNVVNARYYQGHAAAHGAKGRKLI